jgi:hypothetical protein
MAAASQSGLELERKRLIFIFIIAGDLLGDEPTMESVRRHFLLRCGRKTN